jgi:hypothetical protein
MNATTDEAAESVDAAGLGGGLDIEGSKVMAGLTDDGVLLVRILPAGDTPVAIMVDETIMQGTTAGWKAHGKHRKSMLDSSQDDQ